MRDGENNSGGTWHLEKTVSVGHILSTLAIAGSVALWGIKMDARVTVLEVEMTHSKASDDRMEKELSESLKDVRDSLRRIEDKISNKQDRKS